MLLETTNLRREFDAPAGKVRALDGVSLSVETGQVAVVRGPSGCGKTTLLLTVGGLLRPTGGTVRLDGCDPYALGPNGRADWRGANVGFVFQQFHLVPYLTVLENVLAPALAGSGGDWGDRAREVIRLLGLADRARHVPARLSTGERQRTAIARAILKRPRLVLADEPTGNIDDDNARIVLDCLAAFARDGGAVVLATHDERAAKMGTVMRMETGRLREP